MSTCSSTLLANHKGKLRGTMGKLRGNYKGSTAVHFSAGAGEPTSLMMSVFMASYINHTHIKYVDGRRHWAGIGNKRP